MKAPRVGQRVSVHLNLNKSRGSHASWSVVDREPGAETNGRVIFETPCAFLSDCVMKVPTTNKGVDRIRDNYREVVARVWGKWFVPNGEPFTEGSLLESVSFNPYADPPQCYYFHRHDDDERTTRVDSACYSIFLATKQMFCINSRVGK